MSESELPKLIKIPLTDDADSDDEARKINFMLERMRPKGISIDIDELKNGKLKN